MFRTDSTVERREQEKLAAMSLDELFEHARNAAIDCFMIPREWLPEEYRGKRSHRKLRSVVNQLERKEKGQSKAAREQAIQFHKIDGAREIKSASDERLAVVESYGQQAQEEREIIGVHGDEARADNNYRTLYNALNAHYLKTGIIDDEEQWDELTCEGVE